MTLDIQKQKKKLLEEKTKIEHELSSLAERDERGIWQAKQTEIVDGVSDYEEKAEAVTEFEGNTHFTNDLAKQLDDVSQALDSIEKGGYGICVVGGEQIEEDRLQANPSARTCKAHM